MKITPCECTEPGWCVRHKLNKTPFLFRVCRMNASIFTLWENGSGPGQVTAANQPPCSRLGEVVRLALCPACRGHVQLKVFACSKHGECTPLLSIQGVRACSSCEDFEARRNAHDEFTRQK